MASNTETTSHSSSQRKLSLMEDPRSPFFLHHSESPGAILMLNLWLRIIIQPGLEQWEWLWMPRVNLVLLMAPSLLQWQSHHSRNKPGQSAIQWSHHGSWILFHLISQLVSFTETQLLQCGMHSRIAFYKPMDQEFLNFRSKSPLQCKGILQWQAFSLIFKLLGINWWISSLCQVVRVVNALVE